MTTTEPTHGPFDGTTETERLVCGAALERGWLPEAGDGWSAALDYLVSRGDVARKALMREGALHPAGRCGCAGQGACQWCLLTGAVIARDEARALVRRCNGVRHAAPLEADVSAAIARWDDETGGEA